MIPKKKKVGKLTLSNFRFYCKVLSAKQSGVDEQTDIDQWTRRENPKIELSKYIIS